MPNLFINGIFIYPRVINKLDNALAAQYSFAQQRDMDEHIIFKIDGYDDEEIVQTYLLCGGCINADCVCDIMFQIYLKYPMYIKVLSNDDNIDILTEPQLNKCVTNDDICLIMNNHHDLIVRSIEYHDKLNYILIWRTAYDKIVPLKCSRKYYSVIPYLREIFVPLVDNYMKLPQFTCDDESGNIILNEDIFGYHDGMRIIKSQKEFSDAIKNGDVRDLYINCSIDYQIVPVRDIAPDVFATWAIGPKCYKLCSLFMNYQHEGLEKYIAGWNITWLLDITDLFRNCAIRDLSKMNFKCCTIATGAFCMSQIEKAPQFESVVYCEDMFRACKNLIDISRINFKCVENIKCMFMYCKALKYGPDNVKFCNRLREIDRVFKGCIALESAFNNCVFSPAIKYMKFIFEDCTSLESALNNCDFSDDKIIHMKEIFSGCPNLTDALNDCGFLKISGTAFLDCPKMEHIKETMFKKYADGILKCEFTIDCPKLTNIDIF